MNGETTKDEGAQAYAQTGHSELVEALLEDAREEIERLREALEEAQQFIESEFRDPSQEAHGDWLAREARPIHSLICAALGGKP